MASLRPIVDAIYVTLGLAPPVDMPDHEFTFDLSGIPVDLRVDATGQGGLVRATLGHLNMSTHVAQDQLGRLLKIGLGLTAVNRAVLDLPGAAELKAGQDGAHRGVYAAASFSLSDPQDAVEALRSVIEWQGYAEAILGPPSMPEEEAAGPSGFARTSDDEMMIFQP